MIIKDFLSELEYKEKSVQKGISNIKHQKIMIENSHINSLTSDLTLPGSGYIHLGLFKGELETLYPSRLFEGKDFKQIKDILLPYNTFHGISNDLKCLANKQDHLPLESLL